MVQHIYIFITDKERKQLDEIKYKYRISYSTIVKILTSNYQAIPCIAEKMDQDNMIKGQTSKSHIKINDEKVGFKNKKYNYFNNAIHIFCNKFDKTFMTAEFGNKANKPYEKLRNMIFNEFASTKDSYYDYNNMIRYYTAIQKNKKIKEQNA